MHRRVVDLSLFPECERRGVLDNVSAGTALVDDLYCNRDPLRGLVIGDADIFDSEDLRVEVGVEEIENVIPDLDSVDILQIRPNADVDSSIVRSNDAPQTIDALLAVTRMLRYLGERHAMISDLATIQA